MSSARSNHERQILSEGVPDDTFPAERKRQSGGFVAHVEASYGVLSTVVVALACQKWRSCRGQPMGWLQDGTRAWLTWSHKAEVAEVQLFPANTS